MEIQKYDIVIVGSGISGISAAIGASKSDASVLVVDKLPSLGGSSTHSEIGTICGILKNKTTNFQYLVNGFPKEFVEFLRKESNSSFQHNRFGFNYIPYSSTGFLNTVNHFISNRKIDFLFNTSVVDVSISNKMMTSIFCQTNGNKKLKIDGKWFIDCSGNSILSQCAELPTLPKTQQDAAYSFVVSGVSSTNELQINLALMKSLRKGVSEGKIEQSLLFTVPIQGSCQDTNLRFKIILNENTTLEEAIQKSEQLVYYLSSLEGIFSGITIIEPSTKLGIRSSICSIGKAELTENELKNPVRYLDWVAKGDWPIEIWENQKINTNFIEEKTVPYFISYRHITSKFLNNLYFAGKIISAQPTAIASARVQGICIQTGYAVGFLAGEKTLQRNEKDSIKKLQNELIDE